MTKKLTNNVKKKNPLGQHMISLHLTYCVFGLAAQLVIMNANLL